MKVTIDTNILVNDFNLKSPHARVFLDGLPLIPAKLYLPEIVYDETVNKFKEILSTKISELNKVENDVFNLTKEGHKISLYHAERETTDYRKRLRSKLELAKTTFLPYPQTSHKEIVSKILQRRNPFKKEDSGYRDFLIWDTIRLLETSGTEEIVFITNNTKDFGTGPYLSDEFSEKTTTNKNFKICLSIQKFNEEYIIPRLKKLEDLKNKLEVGKIQNFDFKEWINENLLQILSKYDLNGVFGELPSESALVTMTDIIVFNDYRIHNVVELDSKDKLLNYSADLKVEVKLNFNLENESTLDAKRKYYKQIKQYLSPEGYIADDIVVNGSIILDPIKLEVISEEINSISGPGGIIVTSY